MSSRLILLALFGALVLLATNRSMEASRSAPLAAPSQGGSLPSSWIHGSDCSTEPEFQVHAYNEDLYIIRQGKCATFEAPFLYLIFGEDTVMLMDTGAVQQTGIYSAVKSVIDDWLLLKGKPSIPLIVSHTHGHFDHVAGDAEFTGKPGVQQVVGLTHADMLQFWSFTNYPVDTPTIDLGNRVIDVLGTPGHHPNSVTLYDRNTELLLTGDIVYPGHLFIFAENQFVDFADSIQRLYKFSLANPIEWVLGCHVETSNSPFRPYAYGTPVHPNEHPLEFKPEILSRVWAAVRELRRDPKSTIYEDFVIHLVYQDGIFWNG